jgi:acetyltransferase
MPANAAQQHYLRALLLPRAVAVVGASQREGALGRTVFQNAIGGAFAEHVHAVNPRHREVLGHKCWGSVAAIGEPIDLALIATPPDVAGTVLDDCGAAQVKAAIVLSEPPSGGLDETRTWLGDLGQRAMRNGLRLLGPGAFGLVRSDIGLNASVSDVPVKAGRVALVAQSGAVCTAMLDFAAPLHIGFSTVVSLGTTIDVDFGELLDFLLLDERTDSILLYVETVRDARRFHSALRAAARIKPVAVLRSGRSGDPDHDPAAPSVDAVFECAIRRAGTVRVQTYTQLFAAARILALGRIPLDDRIAIIANGGAPALLAADAALERNVRLAAFAPQTRRGLEALDSAGEAGRNPLDVHADATPERMARALDVVLADDNVDAAVVLHVPRPSIAPADMAAAVATVASRVRKPVLAAWLGALDRPGVLAAFDAGGVANFYTPENAIDAFSFLAAYRRHQQWLLEVPPPREEPPPPDLRVAESVLRELPENARLTLRSEQSTRLLAAFGLQATPAARVASDDDARRAARKLGYPVVLDGTHAPELRFRNLRDGRSVSRAYQALTASSVNAGATASTNVRVRKCSDAVRAGEIRIAMHTDSTFGPVISLGASARALLTDTDRKLMLPPLNRRLALDLVDSFEGERASVALDERTREALVDILLCLSALVCMLPWVVQVELDPVTLGRARVSIDDVQVVVDTQRSQLRDYAHMAIHPYPAELVDEVRARDGARVEIRPIRPEDAQMERAFVDGLSEQTRYFRFFYQLHRLTPAMLARFTQIDYDRELALVAVVDANTGGGRAFAGVARYHENPDRISAEYAIVVHDDWQNQGVGRALMQRLIAAARRKGLARLEGAVLAENARMLAFVRSLGFTTTPDPDDPEQVLTRLELQPRDTRIASDAAR